MTDEKSYGLSRNWEVINLSEKIKRYVIEGDDNARVELRNQIIDGENLAEALGYLKVEIKERKNNYETNKEQKDSAINMLISNLEEMLKGKEGTMADEFKKIINEYSKKI